MIDNYLIKPEPIVLAKSFICLNSVFGCRNDCLYCFKQNWDFKNKFLPQVLFTPADILKNLLSYRYYSPNIPLAIHNSATDPFQKGVKEVTFEILDGLEKRKIKNIVGLITKEYVNLDDLKRLEKYQQVRPVIFLTYSGLTERIEKVVKEKRLETMKNLKKANLKKVLYYRPVIAGVNDSQENIKHIIELGEKYFDCIVRSALKLDLNIVQYMAKRGVRFDKKYDVGVNIHDSLKKLPKETREKVDLHLAKAKIPYFKKTSCAISWLYHQADYNAHWIREGIYCSPTCPSEQKKRCQQARQAKIDQNTFRNLLKKIDDRATYRVHSNFISIAGKNLYYSDIKFLRMAINYPVLIEKNHECLTAEEYDTKYHNTDRKYVQELLNKI